MTELEMNVKEIQDTISTLEDFPYQYDPDFSKEVYQGLICSILPLLLSEASAKEIAKEMAKKCPKFGS